MKKFISFSGGVESSAMCLIYGNRADAIFADTGFEHKILYDRIELMESAVREFHKNDFKIIKVTGKHGSLPNYIKEKKFYPSFHARFCTRMFKIEPIDEYLKQYKEEGVELMIGLNADEIDQRTGNHGNLPYVKYIYPLADNGLTRKDCEELLNASNLHPNFPAYMRRGGCVGCFYKSKKEYEAMVHLAPDEFDMVADLEESIQDKRGEYYKIKNDMPSMKDFKKQVQSQLLMFKPEDIYPVVNSETRCGVFCNR